MIISHLYIILIMKIKLYFPNLKHFISLFVINILCVGIFWSLAYLDELNMINNGYINDNSISFTIEETQPRFIIDKDKYILFQFHSNSPKYKHVWLSGNIKLPPIKFIKNYNLLSNKRNVAVIGKEVVKQDVPSDYEIVGIFNSPNSYQLNHDIWLIPNNTNINIKNGTSFIFTTPNTNPEPVLNQYINQGSINIIDRDVYGTYSSGSNQMIINALYISLLFLIIILLVINTNMLLQDKFLIRILYLSGLPIYSLINHIFRLKLLPYITLSIFLFLTAIVFQNFINPLWSSMWTIYSVYLFSGFILYHFGLSLILIIHYTVGKGGKKL